ncbi:hypothetical protein DENSPDRAFT_878000 [Dentipellis sp. KUC8613]|nr:hypothetical protein DENSPDRAFT_878000 [Dentipellis sp. KUC8613]
MTLAPRHCRTLFASPTHVLLRLPANVLALPYPFSALRPRRLRTLATTSRPRIRLIAPIRPCRTLVVPCGVASSRTFVLAVVMPVLLPRFIAPSTHPCACVAPSCPLSHRLCALTPSLYPCCALLTPSSPHVSLAPPSPLHHSCLAPLSSPSEAVVAPARCHAPCTLLAPLTPCSRRLAPVRAALTPVSRHHRIHCALFTPLSPFRRAAIAPVSHCRRTRAPPPPVSPSRASQDQTVFASCSRHCAPRLFAAPVAPDSRHCRA